MWLKFDQTLRAGRCTINEGVWTYQGGLNRYLTIASTKNLGCTKTNVIPQMIGEQIRQISQYLFVISMLAVGLSVDLRDILKIGPKVAATIFSVLLFMIVVSLIGGRLILDH